MFNANSFTVRFYANKVNVGELTLEQVPNLFNLIEEITKLVNPVTV